MKKFLIILFIGFSYPFLFSQTKDIVHLSFNINKEIGCSVSKKVNDNKKTHFYINKEHFEWNPKRELEVVLNSKLDNIDILNISSFLELAETKRKSLIKEGEKDKTIKILFNDEVFEKIYLYEIDKHGMIKRYDVVWIEEIQ